ncbi:MAG: hypothetical protein ACN4EP_13040 [Sediminibacterium sp.]|nr:hypothetical protein [uncultured Sediminibacterium sp.]
MKASLSVRFADTFYALIEDREPLFWRKILLHFLDNPAVPYTGLAFKKVIEDY